MGNSVALALAMQQRQVSAQQTMRGGITYSSVEPGAPMMREIREAKAIREAEREFSKTVALLEEGLRRLDGEEPEWYRMVVGHVSQMLTMDWPEFGQSSDPRCAENGCITLKIGQMKAKIDKADTTKVQMIGKPFYGRIANILVKANGMTEEMAWVLEPCSVDIDFNATGRSYSEVHLPAMYASARYLTPEIWRQCYAERAKESDPQKNQRRQMMLEQIPTLTVERALTVVDLEEFHEQVRLSVKARIMPSRLGNIPRDWRISAPCAERAFSWTAKQHKLIKSRDQERQPCLLWNDIPPETELMRLIADVPAETADAVTTAGLYACNLSDARLPRLMGMSEQKEPAYGDFLSFAQLIEGCAKWYYDLIQEALASTKKGGVVV